MSKEDKKVEIFHRVNKLKLKAGVGANQGPGEIDVEKVKRAQEAIDHKEEDYKNEVAEVLGAIKESWAKLRNAASDKKEAQKSADDLYHYANHVKDLASVYGYELMQHFSESLREFIEKIDLDRKEHLTIVQAHLDVMEVAYHQNIKKADNPVAKELKETVAVAIEKHS